MFLTPAGVVGVWFRGLLSIAIIACGIWLIRTWYAELPPRPRPDRREVARDDSVNGERHQIVAESDPAYKRIFAWRPGFDRSTAMLAGGVFLLFLCVDGRLIGPWLFLRPGADGRPHLRGGTTHRIARPDGAELHVEVHGPDGAPTVVLTHGWSLNRHEWACLKAQWNGRFRMIVWDLPGLGNSSRPPHRDFSLDRLAADLSAVVAFADAPVVLIGHSIGGMTIQTFCRMYPEQLGRQVRGAVLIHTTYCNPLWTMSLSGLMTVLQKPLIEPLLHVQIWLSPLMWLSNLMSYLNGSLHWSIFRSGFGMKVTRDKLDFIARLEIRASPAVVARGCLAMLRMDETATLPRIPIPVLVLAAENDTITLPEASEDIHSAVPGSQLSTLPATKHFGFIEYDQETGRLTADFCESVLTPAKPRAAG